MDRRKSIKLIILITFVLVSTTSNVITSNTNHPKIPPAPVVASNNGGVSTNKQTSTAHVVSSNNGGTASNKPATFTNKPISSNNGVISNKVVAPIKKPATPFRNQIVFKLTFEYAARQNKDLKTSGLTISWNNNKLDSFIPSNYNVNKKQIDITSFLQQGNNILSFQGFGLSDGYGISIDNVRIRGSDGSNVKVINGGFQQPQVRSGWINKNIPGWNGLVQIGFAQEYNSKWVHYNQVIELDGNKNSKISQNFMIKKILKFVNNQNTKL